MRENARGQGATLKFVRLDRINVSLDTLQETGGVAPSIADRFLHPLSHGVTKEHEVPKKEIDLAIKRKEEVSGSFKRYCFKPERFPPKP